MSDEALFEEDYDCAMTNKRVIIHACDVAVRLHRGGHSVKRLHVSCSGSPACGLTLKGPGCPHPNET